MPRPSKGARLYLVKRAGREPVWIIRDGGARISTGTADRREAETRLAEYIASRDRPAGPTRPEDLTISQALSIYGEDVGPSLAAPERLGYAIEALDAFWGHLTVSDVKGATCRRYVAHRARSDATVRRELGVLQAALNHCAREGLLTSAPLVWKPEPPPPRDRYLTRQEAAWLLRAARHLRKDGRHLTRFILIGLYTGTRKAAILGLRLDQPSAHGGWIDTERGVMYRLAEGARQTKKRQPPARLPSRLLSHVRRWRRLGANWAVEDYRGFRVGDIKTGWSRAVVLAGELAAAKGISIDLTGVTPHVLRHTAATWIMQGGAQTWDASGFLGMSLETLQRVYGHHSPHHQASAVDAIDSTVSAARRRNERGG